MARTELEKQFIADHQKLTKGFQRLMTEVELNDPVKIQSAAEALDKAAGPHIEFEEGVLYPRVGRDRGSELEDILRQEHQVARSALTFLQNRKSEALNPVDRARVLQQLRIGFDHAVSCGKLLTHLTVASETEQQDMLDRLCVLREKGRRWTELNGNLMSFGDKDS